MDDDVEMNELNNMHVRKIISKKYIFCHFHFHTFFQVSVKASIGDLEKLSNLVLYIKKSLQNGEYLVISFGFFFNFCKNIFKFH